MAPDSELAEEVGGKPAVAAGESSDSASQSLHAALPVKRTRELQAQYAKELQQRQDVDPSDASAAGGEGDDATAEVGSPEEPSVAASGDEEWEPPLKKAQIAQAEEEEEDDDDDDGEASPRATEAHASGEEPAFAPAADAQPAAQELQSQETHQGHPTAVLLASVPVVPMITSHPIALMDQQQGTRPDPATLSTVSCNGQDLSLDLLSTKGGRRGRGTRRGPMDEMRQLVRILVKIIPQSFPFLATTEDGGGNRISEEQIKFYLDKTLGSAPRPDWGLPKGWGHYVAELFEWATGRNFTEEQARQCAKRLPGRSWEAVDSVLEEFKLRPGTWKLPLERAAEPTDGLCLITEENNVGKSGAEGEEHRRPRKVRSHTPNLSKVEGLPEVDVWKLVHQLLKVATSKQGSTGSDLRETLQVIMQEVKDMAEQCLRSAEAPPSSSGGGVPVVVSGAHAAMPAATHLQPGTGALASMSLQSLQALQQLQQHHQPVAAAQAGAASQAQATMAYPAMVIASSAEGSAGVVHRPVARSSGAFTPVVPAGVVMHQPTGVASTVAAADLGAMKAASDTVSEHEGSEPKGEVVDQQHGERQKQVGSSKRNCPSFPPVLINLLPCYSLPSPPP